MNRPTMNESTSGNPTQSLVPISEQPTIVVDSPPHVSADDYRSPATIIKKNWLYVVFCLVASTFVAYVARNNFAKERYTYHGVLLYNRNTAASPHYTPPQLGSLSAVFKSPKVLDQLATELDLSGPSSVLAKDIDVHVPFGGGSIEVSLTGDSPDEAQGRLERLLQLFNSTVDESRKTILESYLVDFRAGLKRCQSAYEEAKTNQLKLYDAESIVDIDQDLLRVQQEISETSLALDTARNRQLILTSQLDRLTGANGADRSEAANARALLGADMEKRTFLREQLSEKRRKARLAAEVKLKESEFERAVVLHERKLISRAEFERSQFELEALRAQLDGRFQELESEISEIEDRLPHELFGRNSRTQLRADSLVETIAEIELDIVSAEGDVQHLSSYLKQKQAELARLTNLRRRAGQLTSEVDTANHERERLESLVATFEQLRQSEVGEFSVLQPPAPDADFVQSNRTKVTVGAFVLTGMILLVPLWLIDYLQNRQPRAAETAKTLGIPVLAMASQRQLGRLNRVREVNGMDENSRLLSLRIQQAAGCDGSVVLVSNIGRRGMPMTLLWEVARSAACRDNRVVLVDLTTESRRRPLFEPIAIDDQHPEDDTKKEEKPFTLSDYIESPWLEASEIVRPSRIEKVDFVASGSGTRPIEMLGSARISHVLDELRRLYSLVIVIGPSVDQQVDFELLAARADGIVFTATKPHSDELRSAERTIRSVSRMGGRVIGFVV